MTERELRHLFDLWRRRLRLTHWRMELRIEACEEPDSFMEIIRQADYDAAIITVQPWALTGKIPEGVIEFELTPRSIEQKLVHELLHCWTRGMKVVVEDFTDGYLHRDVHGVLTQTFKHEEEHAVDGLAAALVRNWGK